MKNIFFTDVVTMVLTALGTAAALWGALFTYRNHKKSNEQSSFDADDRNRN